MRICKTNISMIAPLLLLCGFTLGCEIAREPVGDSATFSVFSTEDFVVTGNGSDDSWEKAAWLELPQRRPENKESFATRVKVQYSETGIYFLFHCKDNKLSCAIDADFMDLWTEDVVEVFLWPDTTYSVYFEYELSPLNYELPIMISNMNGDLARWMPFHYDADRQVSHQTSVIEGEKEPHAAIGGYIAEFFIPFKLLRPLNNIPPQKGDRWRANFYRVDYDNVESVSWSWQPTRTNFHDCENFGTIIFE